MSAPRSMTVSYETLRLLLTTDRMAIAELAEQAIETRNFEMFEVLLGLGEIDLNRPWQSFNKVLNTIIETSWLIHAAELGVEWLIDGFLAQGAAPTYKDELGYTAVRYAQERGDVPAIVTKLRAAEAAWKAKYPQPAEA